MANVLLKRTVETPRGYSRQHDHFEFLSSIIKENYQVSLSPSDTTNEMPLSERLLKHMSRSHQGLIIQDSHNDPLWDAGKNTSIRSAVIVPLYGRHDLLGLLMLAHETEKYFNMDHLLLLQAIASQAAIAIENAHLYADMAQEQKRLAAVLNHAAEAILMFDGQGKLSLLNPAGEKLFTDFKANIKTSFARTSWIRYVEPIIGGCTFLQPGKIR